MTASASSRQFIIAAALVGLVFVPDVRADSRPKPTTAQLKSAAEAAEKSGDWEAAFSAYCRLYVADRTTPAAREKLNAALRRVQQIRRHRDPAFQQFTLNTNFTDALTLFAEVVSKVPTTFADRTRATPQMLWEFAVEEFDRALGNPTFRTSFLGTYRPEKVDAFRVSLRTFWAKRPIANARDARNTLRELVGVAQDTFAVRTPAAVAIEFICGACSGLDEYTVFLSPASVGADLRFPVADLSAYGLYLSYCDEGVHIDGIAAESWATFHTSLRKGDRITRVNGRPMEPGCPMAAGDALRFPIDGFHELEIVPPGAEMPPIAVRLPVAVPSVFGVKMRLRNVGYVRVANFLTSTPRELDDAIGNLKMLGMRALILDLRGNHGGSFTAAIETAKRLLPGGIIVTTRGQLGEVAGRVFTSDSGMSAHDTPLVVLIDAETASAAEVLAAALKDNNRATLVGMPSYGKGAVQYPVKLTSIDSVDDTGKTVPRSGAVRLTIAKLVSPSGAPLNGVGVDPNVVEPDPVCQLEVALQRAIDLLPPMRPEPE